MFSLINQVYLTRKQYSWFSVTQQVLLYWCICL